MSLPEELVNELKEAVGAENVLSEPRSLRRYADGSPDENRVSTSRWKVGTSFKRTFLPRIVIRPSSTTEVAAAVKICNRTRTPLIPMSGGSNLVGATVPCSEGSILMDMRRMNKILQIDAMGLYAVCQPGVVLSELQADLGRYGLCHGTNPGSSDWATVGGALAVGAQTMTGFAYGTLSDNLLALEVVLPDGQIVRTGPWYGSGYNLKALFVRSEGTLGIITEATVRVHRKPWRRMNRGFLFETFESALKTQIELSSLELSEVSTILVSKSFARDHEALSRVDPSGRFDGWLIVEIEGNQVEQLTRAHRRVSALARAEGGRSINQRAMDSIGPVLSLFTTGAAKSAAGPHHPGARVRISRHIWVPPASLIETYAAFERLSGSYGLEDPTALCTPTRLIVGCLIDPVSQRDRVVLTGFLNELHDAVRAVGGTLFGAHGVGMVNKTGINEEYGEGAVSLMKKIKLVIDPNSILNPGKILDVSTTEDGTRDQPSQASP